MKLAPIQLENYFIKTLHFDLRAGFDNSESLDEEVTLPDFDINSNVTQDTDDARRCRCELTIELTDDPNDKFPYTFAIALVGIFRVSSKYPDDGVSLLLKVNAPSILYSAAREIVLGMSARGGYPPVLLPSVSFVPLPEEITATTKTPASKESSVKTPRPKTKKAASKSQ